MSDEVLTESEFVLDEVHSADSSAVNDTVDESDQVDHPMYQSQPGLLATIAGFFFRTRGSQERERSRRLRELNVSIEYSPESPTLYVLRGELFFERREYHLARADFEKAIAITEKFDPEAGWGVMEQVMCDRALEGLTKIQRISRR